ncbi:thioredoxin [Coprobacter fastidiosus]|uniref:Thioredoxin n=1 Tax=Coprobacter fastidiosus NSB1 = JCM 33896 TaxID=1349822 RepID=A0A495VIW5_9BACT|nr:thioredoxin [Coprobacter fastidiosus]ERM88971.1 hypothetical protein NSB1T_12055 [Coprobacter fastidiosus NSB1 = JCM 33896]RKT49224.1 thioredoxin [Coprobacter fastidiosus NSB1 = JCM 33896]BEG61639.1 thioredoxin [Coprobacter fastidiosus]
MLSQITDENYKEILKSDKLVIIDVYATWCKPCSVIAPILDKLSEEYSEKVLIGKYNIEDEVELCEKYNILSIPTLLFFRNGKMIDKCIGSFVTSTIREKINNL